jgi:hypothetical protein
VVGQVVDKHRADGRICGGGGETSSKEPHLTHCGGALVPDGLREVVGSVEPFGGGLGWGERSNEQHEEEEEGGKGGRPKLGPGFSFGQLLALRKSHLQRLGAREEEYRVVF